MVEVPNGINRALAADERDLAGPFFGTGGVGCAAVAEGVVLSIHPV